MQIIDHWIEYVHKDHTAASISEKSHDYGWDIAKQNEIIPLYAVLAERIPEPDEQALKRLRERARAHGLI